MPPASLSTLAVMIPGPTTARNSRVRPFQRFRSLMRAFHKHIAEDRVSRSLRFRAKSRTRSRTRINAGMEFRQRKSAGRANKNAGGPMLGTGLFLQRGDRGLSGLDKVGQRAGEIWGGL